MVCHRDITGMQVDIVYITPGEKFLYHQKKLFTFFFFTFAMLRQHGQSVCGSSVELVLTEFHGLS